MQLSLLLPVLSLLGTLTAAKQMQVNYYTDTRCSKFASQIDVTWADRLGSGGQNCFNYQYGNSVNIADCYEKSCVCQFYYKTNCGGDYNTVTGGASGDSNCSSGSKYKSFRCFYYN
ncbi:hypothetical protein IFR05_008074 [Cadophora sp. M221]|nr:hypothetical protein IFR05_008074 [Cadophora sp. M221]